MINLSSSSGFTARYVPALARPFPGRAQTLAWRLVSKEKRPQLRAIDDAEKQLTKALPKLAKKASNDQLREAIEQPVLDTEGHVRSPPRTTRRLRRDRDCPRAESGARGDRELRHAAHMEENLLGHSQVA
jgi:hypothetical protein